MKKIAERRDVELRLETRVAQVEADHVTLTTGQSLPSQLTIWRWTRSLFPLEALDHLLGLRIHFGS